VFETDERDSQFELPRTVQFDALGSINVSDARRNELVTLDSTGRVANRLLLTPLTAEDAIPYLAGRNGDTLFVFLAGSNRVVGVLDGHVAADLPIAAEDAAMQLRYVATGGTNTWIKTADPDAGARLVRYRKTGDRETELPLRGGYWSHTGPLKLVGDTLLSVRGYVPVLTRVGPDGVIDSLRLHGFDSPMLARMRSFQLGKVTSPPLLIASVAVANGHYFVINVRPGWLRIDVYNAAGRIEAILTEPDPGFNKSFYPTDIAALRSGGRYLLAVSVSKPRPAVRLYSWEPKR
jgi:hypothetical protein